MVASVNRSGTVRWILSAAGLAAACALSPRLALFGALLLSVIWVSLRDDGAGTWGVLYVLLLVILAVLTLLVAAIALIHRLASG